MGFSIDMFDHLKRAGMISQLLHTARAKTWVLIRQALYHGGILRLPSSGEKVQSVAENRVLSEG